MNWIPSVKIKQSAIRTKAIGFVLLSAASMTLAAMPASARELTPEFSSRIWIDNDQEVGSVCMNGKELITFRARAGSGSAAEEADELAAKLQDLVTDKNFDANQLLPAHESDKATLKLAGNTAISFSPMTNKAKATDHFDMSLKVVNGIRVAMGAPTLPANFPDMADRKVLASSTFSGKASWYGAQFHGRRTSDGSRFDMDKMTAAHKTLPFGTKLLVMNRSTGASCVVEVNDRGPFVGNRVLDLSRGAAKQLHMIGSGVAMVDCLVIGNASNN